MDRAREDQHAMIGTGHVKIAATKMSRSALFVRVATRMSRCAAGSRGLAAPG
jgi:hypothetical protein